MQNTRDDTAVIHGPVDYLRENLNRVVKGKSDTIDRLIVAVLAGGSILLEDVPGVGKTTLAKSLSASLQLKFQRIQCTPDLLPSDVFGFSIFNPQDGTFHFRRGPVFCNLLLVDEINRASPRTQSALLEAMAESQVTVEGEKYDLRPPFLVIATQNPFGFQGTSPLPEAQLDRFLFRLSLEYPDTESEVEMLYDQAKSHPLADLQPAMSQEELLQCQARVKAVTVSRPVADYIVDIVQRTRTDSRLQLGSSPRGSLMLYRAAQAMAFLEHRSFVLPDDVQQVAPHVLAHRVAANRTVAASRASSEEVIQDIVQAASIPV